MRKTSRIAVEKTISGYVRSSTRGGHRAHTTFCGTGLRPNNGGRELHRQRCVATLAQVTKIIFVDVRRCFNQLRVAPRSVFCWVRPGVHAARCHNNPKCWWQQSVGQGEDARTFKGVEHCVEADKRGALLSVADATWSVAWLSRMRHGMWRKTHSR